MAGISYKYYQSVETGKQEDLRFSTIVRLASAYGLDVWELLHPSEPDPKIDQRQVPSRPHHRKRERSGDDA